jgi:hypothetical protein
MKKLIVLLLVLIPSVSLAQSNYMNAGSWMADCDGAYSKMKKINGKEVYKDSHQAFLAGICYGYTLGSVEEANDTLFEGSDRRIYRYNVSWNDDQVWKIMQQTRTYLQQNPLDESKPAANALLRVLNTSGLATTVLVSAYPPAATEKLSDDCTNMATKLNGLSDFSAITNNQLIEIAKKLQPCAQTADEAKISASDQVLVWKAATSVWATIADRLGTAVKAGDQQ